MSAAILQELPLPPATPLAQLAPQAALLLPALLALLLLALAPLMQARKHLSARLPPPAPAPLSPCRTPPLQPSVTGLLIRVASELRGLATRSSPPVAATPRGDGATPTALLEEGARALEREIVQKARVAVEGRASRIVRQSRVSCGTVGHAWGMERFGGTSGGTRANLRVVCVV